MKLIDKIKDGVGKIEIADCTRDELPEFFKDKGFKVGVEIGVYRGKYTEKLCKVGLKVYGVDPWNPYKGYHEHRRNFVKRSEDIYTEAKNRLAPYDCELIRKMSTDAVKDFEDESLDFVYIDGHHGFKYVVEDIYEWSYKIKKGGVISGHDYSLSPTIRVKHAVNGYIRAYKIDPWYVLGTRRTIPGEKRDQWRSWMWIKK